MADGNSFLGQVHNKGTEHRGKVLSSRHERNTESGSEYPWMTRQISSSALVTVDLFTFAVALEP